MKIQRTVFLTGFMGSGKTFWGNCMAEKTGIPFFDLDAMIEVNEERSVQKVFAESGEDVFRAIEKDTLHACLSLGPAIIATGGGTPCFFDNMDWMNRMGQTIYLKTPASVLAERLKHERAFRPLLANVAEYALEEHIEKLLAQREVFYNQAGIILDQSHSNEPIFEKMLLDKR